MVEHAIGVNPNHIRHVVPSKEGGSFTIAVKNELIAQTFGHLFAIPYVHLPLLTFDSMVRNTSVETVDYIHDRWKDVPWKGDVLVRVGHTSVFGDIARSFAGKKDLKNAPPGLMRVLALPFTVLQSIIAKFGRYDHFNAFTNTVHIFHADKAVGMGRMAQAKWFDTMENGVLKGVTRIAQLFIPGVTSHVEWQTFKTAMPKFTSDSERRAASKIFEPYWGKETLKSLVPWVVPYVPPGIFGITLMQAAAAGGLVGGHVMARLYPKQDQRFGYVFEGARV